MPRTGNEARDERAANSCQTVVLGESVSVLSGRGADRLTEDSPSCQGHSSLDAPSELNPPQRIPSPLYVALLVPQAEG